MRRRDADAFKAHLETAHFKKYAAATKDRLNPASTSTAFQCHSRQKASDAPGRDYGGPCQIELIVQRRLLADFVAEVG
jgi:hypothetical protein